MRCRCARSSSRLARVRLVDDACRFHDALLYSLLVKCNEVSGRIPKWPSLSTRSARYNSPRRREQAAATRREILDAAQRLFEQQGYAATTMAAIATEAGVALKTVYVAFETKSGVLRALWNLLLRGDEDDVPVAERRLVPGGPRGARPGAPAPPQRAQLARRASSASARVLEVIRAAAPADPEIEALWDRIQTEYHANQRAIVESLHAEEGARARPRRRPRRPTSSGRSTTRPSGSCSSASAAGRPTSTSSGARTPPSRSSSAATRETRRAPARRDGRLGRRDLRRRGSCRSPP